VATRREIIDGLTILERYPSRSYADTTVGAEHDVLYVGGLPPEELDTEDLQRLKELRFSWEGQQGRWLHYL